MACMTRETIGAQLADLRRRAGLSLSAVAKKAGYSGPSSVQAFFHPDYDPPALDISVAHRLADAMNGLGSPPIREEDVFVLARMGAHKPRSTFTPAPEKPGQVVVYETRHGGRRAWNVRGVLKSLEFFEINMNRRVRSFPAQPGLGEDTAAFALYMAGEGMSPRFRDGEPVFIDPTRPPSRGEDALVLLRESSSEDVGYSDAIFGLLVSRSDDSILLRQHKPSRAARIPAKSVSAMLRVIPWAEVCGTYYG